MTPRRAVALLSVVAVVGAGAVTVPALAAVKPPSPVSFAISPTRIEVHASPGHPAIRILRVQNTGTKPLHLMTYVRRAIQLGNGGFVFDKARPQDGASWFTVTPRALTLKPRQIRNVRIRITIPAAHVQPGQRYLGIIARSAPAPVKAGAKGGAGAATSAGIAEEIILDVPGKVIHSTVYHVSAPSWSTGGSIPIKATITNRGNAYALLNGLHATSGRARIGFPGVLVLGGSIRTVSTVWANPPVICLPCHVQLAGATASVYIVPVYPLIGLVLIVGVLVAMLFIWRRRSWHRLATATAEHPETPPWIADAMSKDGGRGQGPAKGGGGFIG